MAVAPASPSAGPTVARRAQGLAGRILTLQRDSPFLPALLAAIAVTAFLTAQLAFVGHDPYRFVLIGERSAEPTGLPPGARILGGEDGYDGQFYYRLAVDPFSLERTAHGITFDYPAYRQQRILYPLLVWSLSLGNAALVPVLLIAVNAAALVVLAWLGGRYAQMLGRHAAWGALFALYPGFLVTLARDLTEIVAGCFLLAALLLLRGGRPASAAGALMLGVLARETLLGLPLAVLATAGWQRLRTRPTVAGWHLALVPVVVYAAWQALLLQVVGSPPLDDGGTAIRPPLTGIISAIAHRIAEPSDSWARYGTFVGAIVALATIAWRSTRAAPWERAAWLLYLVVGLSLQRTIWDNPAGFLRAVTELALLGTALALAAPPAFARALLALTLLFWLMLAAGHVAV